MTADSTRIGHIAYRDWAMLKGDIARDLFDKGTFERRRYLFRGQRKAEWSLVSSFDRKFGALDLRRREEIESVMLVELLEELEGTEVLELVKPSRAALLAYAQHYGMATRLLDWTLSPYVAAFFAFADVFLSDDFEGYVAVWALDTHSRAWSDEKKVAILDPPKLGNIRLRNQQGRFTLSATHHASLDEYVDQCEIVGEPLKRILVPASEAYTALGELDLMGINYSRLFPGPEGWVKAASVRAAISIQQLSEPWT